MSRFLVAFGAGLVLSAASPVLAATYAPDLAEFSGTDSIAFPPDGSLDLAGGGTIEFWVQPDWSEDPGFDPAIVSNIGTQGASYTVVMLGSRQGIGLLAGETFETLPFDFTDGKLHFVTISDYGEGNVLLMVDNKLLGTMPIGFRSLPSSGFFIGSADGQSNPFKGAIAGLRIWDLPVDPDDLALYALNDLVDPDGAPHPDISALVGVSQFGKRSFSLIEPDPIADDVSDETLVPPPPTGIAPPPPSPAPSPTPPPAAS